MNIERFILFTVGCALGAGLIVYRFTSLPWAIMSTVVMAVLGILGGVITSERPK